MKNTTRKLTIRRFIAICKPLCVAPLRLRLRLLALFVLVVALLWVATHLASRGIHFGSQFVASLDKGSTSHFWMWIWNAVAVLIPIAFCITISDAGRSWLGIIIQDCLTRFCLVSFTTERSFEALNVENPEQKATEELQGWANSIAGLLMALISAILATCTFSSNLWQILPCLTFLAIGYSVAGSIISYYLGRPLAGLNAESRQRLGDFRFRLTKMRADEQSAAIGNEQARIHKNLTTAFERYLQTQKRIVWVTGRLSLFNYLFTGMVYLIPVLVVAHMVFQHQMNIAVVLKAREEFLQAFAGMTFFVAQFANLSNFTAIVNRLGELIERLELRNSAWLQSDPTLEKLKGDSLEVENLTLYTKGPEPRLLVDRLNLSIKAGTSLWLAGYHNPPATQEMVELLSPVGFRGKGRIVSPPFRVIAASPFVIAQDTLEEALMSSVMKNEKPTQQEIIDALTLVGLEEFAQAPYLGTGKQEDWGNVLGSNSRRQQFSLARVILAKDDYVILEGSTSGVSKEVEARVYQEIRRSAKILISTGDRHSLVRHHDQVLEIDDNGSWKVYSAQEYAKILNERTLGHASEHDAAA
jgi:vitamin B12/bleomycin/antimicrobial peptide transport system ATP-binding/permease protein